MIGSDANVGDWVPGTGCLSMELGEPIEDIWHESGMAESTVSIILEI